MTRSHSSVRRMVLCGLFAALTAVCAWICIPIFDIAFTMQTFAIFLSLGILGGKWGTASILIYLLLGAMGLPVFAGFRGGIGAIVGVTGGFLWGFLLSGLTYWALERVNKPTAMAIAMLVCYLCGCLWFQIFAGSGLGFAALIAKCVVPYLIPDAVKIYLALLLSGRMRKYLKY